MWPGVPQDWKAKQPDSPCGVGWWYMEKESGKNGREKENIGSHSLGREFWASVPVSLSWREPHLHGELKRKLLAKGGRLKVQNQAMTNRLTAHDLIWANGCHDCGCFQHGWLPSCTDQQIVSIVCLSWLHHPCSCGQGDGPASVTRAAPGIEQQSCRQDLARRKACVPSPWWPCACKDHGGGPFCGEKLRLDMGEEGWAADFERMCLKGLWREAWASISTSTSLYYIGSSALRSWINGIQVLRGGEVWVKALLFQVQMRLDDGGGKRGQADPV